MVAFRTDDERRCSELNLASMIEVHDGKIEKFVEQNRIDVVVNAARPSLMGATQCGKRRLCVT